MPSSCAEDGIPGFRHARQALCQLGYSPISETVLMWLFPDLRDLSSGGVVVGHSQQAGVLGLGHCGVNQRTVTCLSMDLPSQALASCGLCRLGCGTLECLFVACP